jgi:hypothetical protein
MATYKLHLPKDYAQLRPYLEDKGWLDVFVEIKGVRHPLAFRDSNNIRFELEAATKEKRSAFVAEPGLIVVDKVTDRRVRAVVKQLVETGFFERKQ